VLKKRLLKNPEYNPKPASLIREEARNLRKLLKIDHLHAPNLIDALDRLPSLYPQFKLKLVADFELPNAEARAYGKVWVLKVRDSVFNALEKHGNVRARWTIAHELGHLVLHHPGSQHRKVPGQPVRSRDRLLESEAHIFASEFLAPSNLVAEYRTANEIRANFQISSEAAARRKKEVELEWVLHEKEGEVSVEQSDMPVTTNEEDNDAKTRVVLDQLSFAITSLSSDLAKSNEKIESVLDAMGKRDLTHSQEADSTGGDIHGNVQGNR
jgi:Zn-dependent peptidase ImmA (M78 family)